MLRADFCPRYVIDIDKSWSTRYVIDLDELIVR